MNTTSTQTNAALIIAFLAGILSGRGLFGWDQATWITFLTMCGGAGAWIWTAIATRRKALVASVNAMPEVAGVVTKPTQDGIALANSIPDQNVAPAGSSQAITMAKNGAN